MLFAVLAIIAFSACQNRADSPTKTPETQNVPSAAVYSKQQNGNTSEKKDFSITLEAEDGVLSGNLSVAKSRKKYSGTGYVTGFNQAEGNSIVITVDIPYSQFYKLTVRAGADQQKINYLTVNGKNVAEIASDGKNKDFTDTVVDAVYLEAGKNELGIRESWGWFDFDSVKIETGSGVDSSVYEGIPSLLCNPEADENATRLMEYLTSIYGNYTLAGQYCTHNGSLEVNAIEKVTGKLPALRGFDMIFCSPNAGYSTTAEIDQAKAWAKKGGIVSFSWHWHGPVGANSFYASDSDFRIPDARTAEDYSLTSPADLKKLYENGTLTQKQYRLLADIDVISFHLRTLQNEGIPVLWRPLHEASGGWFWWGASGADDYIWLWKLLYNRMTGYHKLNNLIWVWNAQNAAWYPGDEYVDIVGEDIYADSFNYTAQTAKFLEVTGYSAGKKLTALTENGVMMDPDMCIRDNTVWLWFNVWNGDFLFDAAYKPNEKYTSVEMMKKVYNSELVITLDELPDIFGKCKDE